MDLHHLKIAVTGPPSLIEAFLQTLSWQIENVKWEDGNLCVFNTKTLIDLQLLFKLIEKDLQITHEKLVGRNKRLSMVKARDLFLFCAHSYFKLSHSAASRLLNFKSHASSIRACRAFNNRKHKGISLKQFYLLAKANYKPANKADEYICSEKRVEGNATDGKTQNTQ